MGTLCTQQLSARIRRVWLRPGADHERLPDPCLSDWARAQLEELPFDGADSVSAAADIDGSPCELLGLEQGADGSVRISFALRDDERLWGAFDADAQPGLDRRGDHVHLATELHPYGTHVMVDPCDLCGSGPDSRLERKDDVDAIRPKLGIEQADESNYGELHLPIVFSSEGYAVYVSNAQMRGMLDLGCTDPDRWTFTAPGGEADVYVLGPGSPADLVQLVTKLTGRQPLPPAWALGFLQSRFGYESFDHVHGVLERFEQEQLPVHAVIYDVQWLREHVDLRWNPDGFEDPTGNLARIAERGVRSLVITEPGTRRDASNFMPGVEAGAFVCDPDGELHDADQWYTRRGIPGYRDIEPGEGALVNFFRDDAAEWWYDQHRPLIADGIDGWWFDLNEPEDVPEDIVFPDADWPAAREELHGADVRNLFALAQQRQFARRDLAETTRRPFCLTRSGAAGSQRYGAAPWSGDVGATWDDLRVQPRLGLMAGMCGIPMWGCDVGGFNGDPGPELFARWMQLGAFVPVFRAHGYMEDREPWSQGGEALEAVRQVLTLRGQLLPSIVTWAREAFAAGLPLMRPLLLDFPDDERWHDCTDQWLFGPLLAAPVLEKGATSRTVELPAGEWVDLWSGAVHAGGGSIEVPVDLGTVPVFLPKVQALVVDPAPLDRRGHAWPPPALEVWSFAGEGESAQTTLYVDDGITREHEQGAYSHLHLVVRGGQLDTQRIGGGFPAPALRVAEPSPGVLRAPVAG